MSEPTGTQYGGFWVRFLAFLADSAIVFVISSALFVGAAMALAPDDLTLAVIAIWILGFLYWPVVARVAAERDLWQGDSRPACLALRRSPHLLPRALWREIAKIFSSAGLHAGLRHRRRYAAQAGAARPDGGDLRVARKACRAYFPRFS
jgi:hypothetical protein